MSYLIKLNFIWPANSFENHPCKLCICFSYYDSNEPDHLDLLDDNLDMVYEDDVAYEPIESDSEDSCASAEEEEDSDDKTRSEQVNMD